MMLTEKWPQYGEFSHFTWNQLDLFIFKLYLLSLKYARCIDPVVDNETLQWA